MTKPKKTKRKKKYVWQLIACPLKGEELVIDTFRTKQDAHKQGRTYFFMAVYVKKVAVR
jgi:hypothetical protein